MTDWTLPIIRNLSIILLRRLFITADFELGLNLKVVSMTSSFTYMAYARIIRKKKKNLEKFEDFREHADSEKS